ncbi:MAG: phosphotransferase enzyme family protein [Bacillota bacterium]
MTNDVLIDILNKYGIYEPIIKFLRHNENRTYKIDDTVSGNSYLLRIHQPLKDNMTGLQHTYHGLLTELEMLENLAAQTDLIVQSPVRNRYGDLLTVIEHEGRSLNCSVLTWLEGRDLQKEDVSDQNVVTKLGDQIADLHSFFRYYKGVSPDKRPSQGMDYNHQMLTKIKRGLELGLFAPSDVHIIEETITLINLRLENIGKSAHTWGLIHGDLSMGNIIVTSQAEMSFIDFGFFGFGYYLLDVSMGALLIPSEHRNNFLEGYYGHEEITEEDIFLLEGLMLVAIIGYYAFQIENETVHPWMRERMPLLCANHCIPYLSGERIFYNL